MSGEEFTEQDLARLREELEQQFQDQLRVKESEWKEAKESQKSELDKRDADDLLVVAALQEKVLKQEKAQTDVRNVIKEYEATIQKLLAEKDQLVTGTKESVEDIIRDRDQALEDLNNVEASFSDLHRRYEKTRTAVENYQKNEETLKKCVTDCQDKLRKSDDKYQILKTQAEDRLERVNEELERLRRAKGAELGALQASLRRSELKAQSLQQLLEQKTQEALELSNICDELISKANKK